MIHLRNRKLEAGIYSNSYILPYNLLGTPCLGGVSLGDGRYVKDSTWTEWDDLTAYGFNKSNVEYVEHPQNEQTLFGKRLFLKKELDTELYTVLSIPSHMSFLKKVEMRALQKHWCMMLLTLAKVRKLKNKMTLFI